MLWSIIYQFFMEMVLTVATSKNDADSQGTPQNRPLCENGKSYSYWRLRTLYASIIGYASFYLVRQNFSMAIPSITEEYGFSKTELGTVISVFAVVYGIGKFLNGFISDRSNARVFVTIGLVGSAIISILMGFSNALWMMAILWAINGWFQSMGFPPIARVLTHWFSPRELGTKWSIWSSSHQIGSASIVILAGYLIPQYGWQSAFIIPGFAAILLAFFTYNRLRDNPKSIGFPSVEEYKGDEKHHLDHTDEKLTFKEMVELVFKNRLVWYVSIANMFLYIPRMGVMNWAPTFLKEFKGVDLSVAGWQVAAFDLAGLFGGMAAGYLSDRLFEGRRGPVATIYLCLLIIAMFMLWQIPAGHPLFDGSVLMMAGFFVSGPQVLVGIALADFASKRAVGVATGFAGVMGYGFGTALSGAGVGKIVDTWGWNGGFTVFTVSSVLAAVFFGLTWKAQHQKQKATNASV